MSQYDPTAVRLQLLANGYLPLANRGKMPVMHGWNTADYVSKEISEKRIASWARRFPDAPSTGIRVEAPMAVMDADVDDSALSALFWQAVAAHAPQLLDAPLRFGAAEFKCALFFQLAEGDEPFVRLASHHYRVDDGTHCVEVFGGAMLKGDRASRQFGVAGPHSFNKDGSVAAEYLWERNSLMDTPRAGLPVATRAQVAAVIDAFDRAAAEGGFHREVTTNNEHSAEVFDIDDNMRFDVHQGPDQISYEELCVLWDVRGRGLRVAWHGRNRTKGLVGWSNRHQCVEIYDTEGCAHHYPAEAQPVSEDAFAETLREVAAEHGIRLMREPPWREVTKTGAPRPSLHNARLAIEALGVHCSEDVFHHRLYVGRSPASSPSEPLPSFAGAVTDAAVGALRILMSDTFGIDFTEKHVRDAVNTLAHENRFDPVLEMLAEAEASWDGVKRLDRMAHEHFGCADTELNRACVRKTMIAAVARARVPGIKFDTIPVLEGPEGWNKSTAWAVLAGEGNFSDASILGHSGREVQEQLADVWIHENAELAGMKKAEVEVVKAFASRQDDRARPAYGHYLVVQPRRSIEVGTTNSDAYLHSPTGNRRFWPLLMERRIDLDRLRRERLQLWGEAAAAQTAGEGLTLPEELWKAAGAEQEERRVRHPWEAILEGMCEASGPLAGSAGTGVIVISRVGDEQRVHTADIFRHVLRMPDGQMNRGHAMTLQEIMKLQGWRHRGNLRIEGRQGYGYSRKTVT